MLGQLEREFGCGNWNYNDSLKYGQVAAAVLLLSALEADHIVRYQEKNMIISELQRILKVDMPKLRKVISRAAAERGKHGIFSSAALLSLRSDKMFRNCVLTAARRISRSDRHYHWLEKEHVSRLTGLLRLKTRKLNRVQ